MSASDCENGNQKRHKQAKQSKICKHTGIKKTIDIHTAIDSLDKKHTSTARERSI